MSDTPTYDQLSALCAQLVAALEAALPCVQSFGSYAELPPVVEAITAYHTLSPDPQWQRVPEGCVVVPVDLLGEVVGTLEALDAQTPTKSCQATIVKIYELVERARGEG